MEVGIIDMMFWVFVLAAMAPIVSGFVSQSTAAPSQNVMYHQDSIFLSAKANEYDRGTQRLFKDFKMYNGEIINPYKVLKVDRSATNSEIKKSYRQLSKRYHPDAQFQNNKGMLPGRCSNLHEVREEWERIKLSYEILKDRKTRQQYDRNEVVADPGAAVRRAAVDAVGKGIANIGSGVFAVGAWGLSAVTGGDDKETSKKTS